MATTFPKLEEDVDYRADFDGTDWFLSASVQRSLCLYCGYWYSWDEAHGQIIGGCYPPVKTNGIREEV